MDRYHDNVVLACQIHPVVDFEAAGTGRESSAMKPNHRGVCVRGARIKAVFAGGFVHIVAATSGIRPEGPRGERRPSSMVSLTLHGCGFSGGTKGADPAVEAPWERRGTLPLILYRPARILPVVVSTTGPRNRQCRGNERRIRRRTPAAKLIPRNEHCHHRLRNFTPPRGPAQTRISRENRWRGRPGQHRTTGTARWRLQLFRLWEQIRLHSSPCGCGW
jgi:hypothetical protein